MKEENKEMPQKEVIYQRGVHYYETDQMAIVHHSNYIRWFEEARIYMMDQVGILYDQMEKDGILIPVLSVSSKYKIAIKYGQKVDIHVWITGFNGIRLTCGYEIIDPITGIVHCTGDSEHCFVDQNFKPVNLKRKYPKYYDLFAANIK